MSANKKYFYIKLKESFFEQPSLILLEKMPNGYLYSNILLKMYLKSIKFDGKLLFTEDMPYTLDMLSAITGHDISIIEQAIKIFKQLKLISVLKSGIIYMLDIQTYIGHSSTEADRQREYYQRVKDDSSKEQCKKPNKNSTVNKGENLEDSTPEIDIELDKRLDNREELNLEKKEYIRKKVIENAMKKSFYKSSWSFLPDGTKEQDYKLGVYDAIADWILHNDKDGDLDFLESTIMVVKDIYTHTSNNPEAIANIRECIASNKPILIPDSMRSVFKKIQEANTPLSPEEMVKKCQEAMAKLRKKDGE